MENLTQTLRDYPRPLLASDAREALEAADWPRPVVLMRLRAGANNRHQSRMAAAARYACSAVLDLCYAADPPVLAEPADVEAMDGDQLAAAAALCALEAHGTGGYQGEASLGATDRMTWARCCAGKGRHRASDGPAWDAAIEAARCLLYDAALSRGWEPVAPPLLGPMIGLVADYLDGPQLEWALAYGLWMASGAATPDEAAAWIGLASQALREAEACASEELEPPVWLLGVRALCQRWEVQP